MNRWSEAIFIISVRWLVQLSALREWSSIELSSGRGGGGGGGWLVGQQMSHLQRMADQVIHLEWNDARRN